MAGPLRLLIIDAHGSLQRGLGEVALSQGHQVTLVSHSDKALAVLASRGADVLVLDFASPAASQLLRDALAASPQLVIIALVPTDNLAALSRQALDSGAWDYIPQPCDPALVRAALQRAQARVLASRAEEEAQRCDRELRALQRATNAITASLDPDQVLNTILVETKEILHADSASVLLVDEEKGGLVFWATSDGTENLAGQQVPIGKGIANWSVEHDQSVLSNDAEGDQRFYSGIDRVCEYKTRNLVAVPLRVRSQVIGAIEAVNKTQGDFTAGDQALLEALALPAAAALQNALLHRHQREEHDLLQAALSTSSSGMTVIDARGKVAFCNAAAAKLLRLDRDEVLGQDAAQLLARYADLLKVLTPPEMTWRSLAESLSSTTEAQRFVVSVQSSPPLVLDISVTPVRYPADEPVSRLVAWRDITREQEVARWHEELGYIIVHDLRNPLSLVRVGIEAAQMFLPPDTNADALQGLTLALRGVAQLERRSSIMLAVNQLEAGAYPLNKVAASMPELVEAAYCFYGFEAQEREVALRADLPPSLPAFYADGDLLEWTLGNLVYYAVKRSTRPGGVTIAVRPEGDGVHISVTSRQAKPLGNWQPFYRIGEDADKQDEAAFYADGSSGLGLYFCRLAIQAHGGKIWAEDNAEGQAFQIWLPTGEASPPPTTPYGA